ncbi:MAG: four helix bundle protein [Hyphomicrobium sp.]
MGYQINSYQDLEVWQLAVTLAEDCYRLVAKFPKEETFGLTSQIRRAAVSIPANIAEGYGRDQTGSFIQFLRIAQGSARELETHLVLAARLEPASQVQLGTPKSNCDRVSKMLRALIRSLEARRSSNAAHD